MGLLVALGVEEFEVGEEGVKTVSSYRDTLWVSEVGFGVTDIWVILVAEMEQFDWRAGGQDQPATE